MGDSEQNDLGIVPNRTASLLRSGDFAIGTWLMTVETTAAVRMLKAADFDFVFLDMEHSAYSFETIGAMCEMARACGITPIVRPYDTNGHLVNRIQDLGAMGLMFHDITSRAQVDELLHWMQYPPKGVRGSTSLAAPMDYRIVPGDPMKRFINENMLLVIQIESREGVENVDSILSPGGVDIVEIGRGDLSTSYGVPLDIRNPIVLEAVDEVIASCERHGVIPGVNCVSEEDVADLVARGVRCVSFSSDRKILVNSFHEAGAMMRAQIDAARGVSVAG